MSVYIPFDFSFIGIRSEDEPHFADVCDEDCFSCWAFAVGGCLREQRATEDVADALMLSELIAETTLVE